MGCTSYAQNHFVIATVIIKQVNIKGIMLYGMVKITRGRGTSTGEADPEQKWAGDKFKEYQKEQKEKTGNEDVVTGRGTSSQKHGDIPETESPDTSNVSKTTKRGTDSD